MIIDPMPEVMEFSSAYYLVDGVVVEPVDDERAPLVQDHLYGYLQDAYYGSSPTPILFRHGETGEYFEVEPSSDVRIDTIAMPREMIESMELDLFPDEEHFLLAKPRHAQNLFQLSCIN